MESAVTSKQKSVLGLLLPIFEETPRIQPRLVTQECQRLTKGNFTPRAYAFQGKKDLVHKLNVFDHHDGGAISVSESKLFDLLLRPLMSMRLSPHELDGVFEKNNGFNPAILCRYCKVENLQQLVEKYTRMRSASSFQAVAFRTPGTAPAGQQAQHDLHPQPSQPHPTPSPSLYPLVSRSDPLPREACTTEHINVCSTKQKSALALLMPLFQSLPRIKPQQLAYQYEKHYRANFSPRMFDFRCIDDLIAKLGVFDKDGSSISLSESKLFSLLVHPLLTDHQPPLEQAFERENGFKSTILCKYCKVKTLQQLVDKCVGSATAVQADNSAHLPLTTEPVTSYTTDFPPLGYAGPSPPKRAVNTFFQEQAPGFTASHHLQPYPPLSQTHQPLSQAHQPAHPLIERYPNSDIPLREEAFLPALPSVRKNMEVPKSSSQLRFPSFSKLESKQQAQKKLEVYLQNHIAHLSQQRKHLPSGVVITFTKQSVYKANEMLGRQLFK